eukprot:14528-Heterococcus_DN1.PRE.1
MHYYCPHTPLTVQYSPHTLYIITLHYTTLHYNYYYTLYNSANVSYVQSAEANPFLPAGTQPMIATYSVTGIEKFAAETVKDGLGLPKVTLRFVMDAFGVPVLDTADATVVFDKE